MIIIKQCQWHNFNLGEKLSFIIFLSLKASKRVFGCCFFFHKHPHVQFFDNFIPEGSSLWASWPPNAAVIDGKNLSWSPCNYITCVIYTAFRWKGRTAWPSQWWPIPQNGKSRWQIYGSSAPISSVARFLLFVNLVSRTMLLDTLNQFIHCTIVDTVNTIHINFGSVLLAGNVYLLNVLFNV